METRPHSQRVIFAVFFLLLCSIFGCLFPKHSAAAIWNDYAYIRNAVCIQPEGDYVWIGSTNGVWRIKRSDGTFVQYTTQHGLVNMVVMDIAIDESNNKWFATLGGVSRFDNASWVSFTTQDGLVGNQVRSVAVDGSGVKWFGTSRGVSSYDGEEWKTYRVETGLVGNMVNAIAVDPSGYIWFGTNQGVSRFNGVEWESYTTGVGLAHNKVNAIAIDSSGNKWFGTDSGVSRYIGNTWTTFRTDDGLSADLVNDIAIDTAGNKWFGCYGGGVSEFFDEEWQGFTKADGLISNQVTAVAVDMDGHTWIGTAIGVSELDTDISEPDMEDATNGELLAEDMNNDGVTDDTQENVASLRLSDGGYLTIVATPGTRITDLSMKDVPSNSSVPSDLDFTYGLIDFTIEDVGVGKSAVVTLNFPEDATPKTYYKYGPTPDQPQDHWYEFMYNGETGAKIEDNVVTLYFVDGKRGDDVYTLDGKIVDIGGPGFKDGQTASVPASTGGDSGGDSTGGCFLGSLHEE